MGFAGSVIARIVPNVPISKSRPLFLNRASRPPMEVFHRALFDFPRRSILRRFRKTQIFRDLKFIYHAIRKAVCDRFRCIEIKITISVAVDALNRLTRGLG